MKTPWKTVAIDGPPLKGRHCLYRMHVYGPEGTDLGPSPSPMVMYGAPSLCRPDDEWADMDDLYRAVLPEEES